MRRTPSGESNKHMFLRVDAIVYVEGGRSFSAAEVRAGRHDIYSIDIQFWQKVFTASEGQKKFEFRAIGSKGTLLNLAEDVLAGRVRNVIIAMDKDHDEFKEELRIGRNVVYTRGYSWECDVWGPDVAEEVFFAVCPVSRVAINARGEIDNLFEEFRRALRWPVYADILLAMHGGSLLPRDKPDRVLQLQRSGRPSVRVNEIVRLVKEKRDSRTGSIRIGRKIVYDSILNCVGHVVRAYCYRMVCYLLRRFSTLPKIPRQYVESVAIEKFGEMLKEGRVQDMQDHYRRELANVRV